MGASNPRMNTLIRAIYTVLGAHNIRLNIQRITTTENVLADLLSRGRHKDFQAARARWLRHGKTSPPSWRRARFRPPTLLLHRAQSVLGIPPTPRTTTSAQHAHAINSIVMHVHKE